MEKITTQVKKWGNSFGIILPKKTIEREKLREGIEITVTIEPRDIMTVSKLAEFAKKQKLAKSKKSTQEIINEIDQDMWGEE